MFTGRCCHCPSDDGSLCHGCNEPIPVSWEVVCGTISTSNSLTGSDSLAGNPFNPHDRFLKWEYPDLTYFGTNTIWGNGTDCDWVAEQGETMEIRGRLGTSGGMVEGATATYGPVAAHTDPGTSDGLCGTGTPTWECRRYRRSTFWELSCVDTGGGVFQWRLSPRISIYQVGWATAFGDATDYTSILQGGGSSFPTGAVNISKGVSMAGVSPPWPLSTANLAPNIARYAKNVNCATDFNGSPFTLTNDGFYSTAASTFAMTVPSTVTLEWKS